ncbi:MAG TPA: acyl-CoA thioesterase II [Polyangiaceae bacterium]|nr:acyl-CoA thioesterase II [Polyangiaceae bacterium]
MSKTVMTDSAHVLLDRLNLETLDRDLFRGFSPEDGRARVFGGQVAAQALIAACRTVEGRIAHSLHAYFLRPGDPSIPIIYEVDRIRDGKSFTTRRVVAIQRGEAIFNMSASYHVDEPGPSHQIPMPEVPRPESLPSNEERLRASYEKTGSQVFEMLQHLERPVDVRDSDPYDFLDPKPRSGPHMAWFKTRERLPDDPLLHQCALAYASDLSLLDTSLFQHGLSYFKPNLFAASLDHTMWFHRPFRADEWLLYVTQSPTTGGSRGFNQGSIFTLDGTLVASAAQECLMRVVSDRSGR